MNSYSAFGPHLSPPLASWLENPNDATKDGVQRLRLASDALIGRKWPAPYDRTIHCIRNGDARNLDFLEDQSIHLVVTSPPYWTLKNYEATDNQMGSLEEYDTFLAELKQAIAEMARVLVPGGRACINVGDVCLSRKEYGRHLVVPLHADIQVIAREVGLDCLTPIIWQKIANGKNEVERGSSGFYGKPYQPGAIIKNDIEYILFFRKPGSYRNPTPTQKALSLLTERQMKSWFRSVWTDLKGASTRNGHPAPYPIELAERLIRMFSFAGDTVLDPFAGSGTTGIAAMFAGRSSLQVEIAQQYVDLAVARMRHAKENAPEFLGEAQIIL